MIPRRAILPGALVVLAYVLDSLITLAMGGSEVEVNPVARAFLDRGVAIFFFARAAAVVVGVVVLARYAPGALWVVAGYYGALVGFEIAVAAAVGLGLFG